MYRRRQWRIVVPFLLPALILYLLFVVYPDLNAFWVSLHRWRGLRIMTFVGLENFAKMPRDRIFRLALEHNIFFMVVNTVGTVAIALAVAVLLTGKLRGAGFFRTVYFFPSTLSVIAIAAVWKMIYSPIWGPPALLFQRLGLDAPLFLGSEKLVLPSIATVVIWGTVGLHMTLYIAGIQNIPDDFYDAVRFDGANVWELFRFVSVPLLGEVLRVSMVFLLILRPEHLCHGSANGAGLMTRRSSPYRSRAGDASTREGVRPSTLRLRDRHWYYPFLADLDHHLDLPGSHPSRASRIRVGEHP